MIEEERTIEDARRVRHLKRGTEYEVLGRASVQASHPIQEGDTVVVYRGEADGALWARPADEFEDGRFESLPDSPFDLSILFSSGQRVEIDDVRACEFEKGPLDIRSLTIAQGPNARNRLIVSSIRLEDVVAVTYQVKKA